MRRKNKKYLHILSHKLAKKVKNYYQKSKNKRNLLKVNKKINLTGFTTQDRRSYRNRQRIVLQVVIKIYLHLRLTKNLKRCKERIRLTPTYIMTQKEDWNSKSKKLIPKNKKNLAWIAKVNRFQATLLNIFSRDLIKTSNKCLLTMRSKIIRILQMNSLLKFWQILDS